jgi:hypothetical protein
MDASLIDPLRQRSSDRLGKTIITIQSHTEFALSRKLRFPLVQRGNGRERIILASQGVKADSPWDFAVVLPLKPCFKSPHNRIGRIMGNNDFKIGHDAFAVLGLRGERR